MKALQGALAENAARTLAAGCDLTLHCSGDLDEMRGIAPAVPAMTPAAAARLAAAQTPCAAAIVDPSAEADLVGRLLAA